MPPTSLRRTAAECTYSADDFAVPEDGAADGGPDAAAAAPKDPARAAARLMLRRALDAAGVAVAEAARDGAVCLVRVPTAEDWVEAARDEWKDWTRRGERYEDGAAGRYWSDGAWVAWGPEEEPRKNERVCSVDAFARAVSEGRHCAAFAPDHAWLPADLVRAADHRLELPVLTGADVAELARWICGGEASEEPPDDAEAASLTPRLLRLARRPGQTADAYLGKLKDLMAREREAAAAAARASAAAAAAAGAGPRDPPTLDRLHGMREAVNWGNRVARDLAAYKAGALAWADVDKGCLLSGPPGCGKTLFARALAATCGVPLVSGSHGQWHASGNAHQGEFLKAMAKSFADAKRRAPAILFVDEVDAFPNRATVTHRYRDYEVQVVNALLALIDGVEGREGVVLLAACNHPELLDPALTRSGRLDRHIRIGPPDRTGLERILREHLGGDLAGEALSGAALAAAGASGADCERFVRGARRRARGAGRAVALADLLAEIGGADGRTPAQLRLAAAREAGHAVASCELHPGGLRAVTLRAAGESGGGTLTVVPGGILSAADVHRRLVALLAWRAAEEALLGEPSSGAGGGAESDLAQATGLAATAAAALGLDAGAGLVWSGMPDGATLPGMLAADPALAARVRAALDAAYADALALVRRRRAAVEAVAAALLERRALDGAEAAAIAARHPAGTAAAEGAP